ncbi:LamG-like jellyroll fold domain-containing protein [Spirosoma flavum]|uniref:LamG-like jellyroll fold domain-containing protein n=1 Tax=Spirosoma flavum TaxID=2048557 RepID=A0ABW6AP96_9BACT
MKTSRTYLLVIVLLCGFGSLLLSCGSWEVPTKKTQRECVKPSGTLNTQIQGRKVDFSITNSTGTIDKVIWDFGNGSTTVTTGMTVSYTYSTTGTYNAKATLSNSCVNDATIGLSVTIADATIPAVSLQPASGISSNSATLGMTVTSTGNATITQYGICYSSTNTTPTIEKGDPTSYKDGSVGLNTAVPFSLTNLQPNTTYYVRSYAVNQVGTGYSTPVQSFRTGSKPAVSITGAPSTGITTTSVNFIVTNSGSPAAIEYGICYSSGNTTPVVDNSNSTVFPVATPAVGANTIVNLLNLNPNTKYYYRAYAKLPSGEITYSPTVESFTTQVDTLAVDLIASVSFTNQSLLDVSGYNNHVKLVDNPTFTADRNGNANSAILLDGVNDYFYMPENSNNSLEPDALSISIWIKPVTLDRRMQVYNKSRFNDGAYEMYSSLLKLENDIGPNITILTDIKQNSLCQSGKGWQSFPITNRIQLNTWHHLVFTYSGRSARMYFDGALQYSSDDLPASSIDKCFGGDLKFGAQYKDLPWYFYGAMDDIRIYKRVLSTSEVQTLSKQ